MNTLRREERAHTRWTHNIMKFKEIFYASQHHISHFSTTKKSKLEWKKIPLQFAQAFNFRSRNQTIDKQKDKRRS